MATKTGQTHDNGLSHNLSIEGANMDKESAVKSEALWNVLFLAVQNLTEAGEIEWRPEDGGLRTDIRLLVQQCNNQEDLGAISFLIGEKEDFDDADTFLGETSNTLHKFLRDRYGYSAEGNSSEEASNKNSLYAVIAATPDPTTLPTWQTNPIEAEEVG
jgi:hypothetical protein